VITLLTVLGPDANSLEIQLAKLRLERLIGGSREGFRIRILSQPNEFEAIRDHADASDLLVVHAPVANVLEQRLFGSIPQRLAKESSRTVIMVKAHDPIQSKLGRLLGLGGSF
jgi:nucleotide-binding universal stress UspA family protein